MINTGDVPKIINSQVLKSRGAQLNNGEKYCTNRICPTKMTTATAQNTLLSSMLLKALFHVAKALAFNIFQNCKKTKTLKKMPISCGLKFGLMPLTKILPPLASLMK